MPSHYGTLLAQDRSRSRSDRPSYEPDGDRSPIPGRLVVGASLSCLRSDRSVRGGLAAGSALGASVRAGSQASLLLWCRVGWSAGSVTLLSGSRRGVRGRPVRSGCTAAAACGYGTGVGVSAAETAAGGVHGFPAVLTSFVSRAGPVRDVAGLLEEDGSAGDGDRPRGGGQDPAGRAGGAGGGGPVRRRGVAGRAGPGGRPGAGPGWWRRRWGYRSSRVCRRGAGAGAGAAAAAAGAGYLRDPDRRGGGAVRGAAGGL